MRLVTLLTFVLIPAIASGQSERPAGVITDALRGLSPWTSSVNDFLAANPKSR